ncbi:hypothetical protein GM921_17160 [Pedobacter sp. LMG 31464]|uniref:Uncharacterized protein n=1 Tax=Pedobacter planticolens TaxID=2679964 RepID=A0A923E2J9_9SPHI|nr:hypothetical protein [Pedobacter planticolens]MBB2147233.1 hypothetical protein [Pedobacter planticolens]
MKKIFCLIATIHFFYFNATAQRIDRMFKINIEESKLQFTMPDGFKELDSGLVKEVCDGKISPLIIYRIANRDTSVIIGYSILNLRVPLLNTTTTRFRLNNTVKYLADTSKHPIERFEAKKLALYNASAGGIFYRKCEVIANNYLHKYVYLNKDILTEDTFTGIRVIISYYYTPQHKNDIGDILVETSNHLKFR